MKPLITIKNTKTNVFHRFVLNQGTITAQTKMSTETFYKTVKWLRPKLSQSELPLTINPKLVLKHVQVTTDNLYGTLPINKQQLKQQ